MEQEKTTPSVASVIEEYLEIVKLTRSQNTALTYGKALKEFKKLLVNTKLIRNHPRPAHSRKT